MAVDMSFLIADEDYYEPWDTVCASEPLACRAGVTVPGRRLVGSP